MEGRVACSPRERGVGCPTGIAIVGRATSDANTIRRQTEGVDTASRFALLRRKASSRCSASFARIRAYCSFVVRGIFIGVETQASPHPSLHEADMIVRGLRGDAFLLRIALFNFMVGTRNPHPSPLEIIGKIKIIYSSLLERGVGTLKSSYSTRLAAPAGLLCANALRLRLHHQ